MLKKLVREEGISQADRVEMRRLLDADIPQCLKYIHSSTARMDQLIKGFLKISRLGRMAPKIRLLDMNRLMKDVVKSLRFLISEKNVDLEIAVLEPCRGDSIYIHQVFSNLLNNALKYLDPGRKGKIRVYSERREENTVYVVEDNGRGIDVSNLEKVFELFYREDPRGAIPGEGLGLSAVRWIVGRHWGKVWVESEAGKGSRFFVELPGE
jgi:signal transduction histidine kinase